MDRLTYRIASGATNLIGIIEANGPFEKAKLRQAGWERLAAYEDTGLEPDGIESLVRRFNKCFDQKQAFLKELADYKPFGAPEQIAAAMAELEEIKSNLRKFNGMCNVCGAQHRCYETPCAFEYKEADHEQEH